nr:prolyl-tRNA synthetase associated domain-containing protein [Anaerotruncus colihominis]
MEFLQRSNIDYELVEHPPARTIDEIESFNLPNGDYIVKNLFLRDDKKRNYYLLTLRKDKTVNLKKLREILGTRPLSFASEEDLSHFLALPKGSVTPLGILNDESHCVQVLVDSEVLLFPVIGIHPNDNTATIWLAPKDLQSLVETHGNPFFSVNL